MDVLLQIIGQNKDNNYVQRVALLTLENIAEGHEEVTAMLIKRRVIQRVFKVAEQVENDTIKQQLV